MTIALATWRDFPWRKVPGYVFAQVMGGLAGAALVYANYYHAINIFEGGSGVRTLNTAGLFSTYAVSMTNLDIVCPYLITNTAARLPFQRVMLLLRGSSYCGIAHRCTGNW